MGLIAMVFGFAGAKINHLLQYPGRFSWQSGFVFYGGLIGGVAAASVYVRTKGVSLPVVADLAAAPVMLGLAIGRVGCFLTGCCYGKPTDGYLGVRIPNAGPAPVLPTQLFESAATLAFFFLLSWLYRRPRKFNGEVFLVMATLYAVWRFLIEFVRGDDRPIWAAGLFYSQWVSLAAFAAALATRFFAARERPAR